MRGKLILLVASLYLSLIVAELCSRIIYTIPKAVANYYAFSPARVGATVTADQYEYKVSYSYNQQGFRDHEFDFSKPRGKKRILFLGDSFTEGFGVDEEKRYSNIVAEVLGSEYQSINAGQVATNPNNYFDNLVTFGMALNPSIVVMTIFIGNDFMGGRNYKLLQKYQVCYFPKKEWVTTRPLINVFTLNYINNLFRQVIKKKKILYNKYMDGNYWDLYFNKKITKEFYIHSTKISESDFDIIVKNFNQSVLKEYYSGRIIPTLLLEGIKDKMPYKDSMPYYNEEDYHKTFWFIKETASLLSKHNIRFIVIVVPDINQVHPKVFAATLKRDFLMKKMPERLKQLEDLRIKLDFDLKCSHYNFIDMTGPLKKAGELTYYIYDQHLNEKGHKIIAQELLNLIK